MNDGQREEIRDVVLETAPIGLMSLDVGGKIQWTNTMYSELLGMPRDELIGTLFFELIESGFYEEETVDQYLTGVRTLLSSRTEAERYNYVVQTHLPDEETLVHDVSMVLLPLVDGQFQGTVIAFRDITTQMAYERELDRQNELLEDFASVVSHDLRNPLNVAQGYTDLAIETGDKERLRKVEQAHARMETLIDDLLLLTLDGKDVQNVEPVAVEAVVQRAWESVDTGAGTLELLDGIGRVDADASRFQQLFENLFRNSVEHGFGGMTADETPTITVGPLDESAGFFVADNGPGIPPELRPHVFERGFTAASNGTGFGLAIVKTVVEAHDWQVEIADTETGARFEITTAGAPSQ